MLLCPWNSPGKSSGVGSHFLLQGIFLTQGLNPGLLHCRQILYHLSHQGSPHPILRTIFYAHVYLTFNNLGKRILYNGEKVFSTNTESNYCTFLA